MGNSLFLKTPDINELDYRIKLLADPLTMEYNAGYGEDGTGCYHISMLQAENWYSNWLCKEGNYYAYVVENKSNVSVGEVNFHYDSETKRHMIGVVIEAAHRGKGYAVQALNLLADKAFNGFHLSELANDFPKTRIAAEKAHKKAGFIRVSENLLILTKERYLAEKG